MEVIVHISVKVSHNKYCTVIYVDLNRTHLQSKEGKKVTGGIGMLGVKFPISLHTPSTLVVYM